MKKLFIHLSLAFAAIGSLSAIAGDDFSKDLTVVPSVSYGTRTISFENTSREREGEISETFATTDFSLAFVYKDFYITGNIEKGFLTDPVSSTVDQAEYVAELDRIDYGFTFGYNAYRDDENSISVFTGYKYGETTISPEPDANYGTSGNVAYQQKQAGNDYELTYRESGLFIGGSYAYSIPNSGTISASLAYAVFNGEFEDNDVIRTQYFYEGDTRGFSYGIKWSDILTDRLNYFVSFKRHGYSFSGTTDNTSHADENKFDETITTLSAGISAFF